jgi:hypothetical protein
MNNASPRRTFGQKQNARRQPTAKPKERGDRSRPQLAVSPAILAVGAAFLIAAFAVVMLGGQPVRPPGGVVIIETPAQGQPNVARPNAG